MSSHPEKFVCSSLVVRLPVVVVMVVVVMVVVVLILMVVVVVVVVVRLPVAQAVGGHSSTASREKTLQHGGTQVGSWTGEKLQCSV